MEKRFKEIKDKIKSIALIKDKIGKEKKERQILSYLLKIFLIFANEKVLFLEAQIFMEDFLVFGILDLLELNYSIILNKIGGIFLLKIGKISLEWKQASLVIQGHGKLQDI